jgi:hypothetical protein
VALGEKLSKTAKLAPFEGEEGLTEPEGIM